MFDVLGSVVPTKMDLGMMDNSSNGVEVGISGLELTDAGTRTAWSAAYLPGED